MPILHQDAHNSGVYRAGSGIGQADTNIKVSNMQANSAGTQITASVQILPAATLGPRQVRLQTSYGTVMGMATNSPFNVTNPRNLEGLCEIRRHGQPRVREGLRRVPPSCRGAQ